MSVSRNVFFISRNVYNITHTCYSLRSNYTNSIRIAHNDIPINATCTRIYRMILGYLRVNLMMANSAETCSF